jgi:hypothetical protein
MDMEKRKAMEDALMKLIGLTIVGIRYGHVARDRK